VIVGLADSGIAPELEGRVIHAKRFKQEGDRIVCSEAQADTLGHGTALSRIIAQQCPEAEFVLAQIISPKGASSLQQLSACIPWLAEHAQLINLSLGLRRRDSTLESVCQQAHDNNCVLVASAPAMGEPVYPAAFASVLSITGDINCRAGEFTSKNPSANTQEQTLFGACCFQSKLDQSKGEGGASFAAAHFSGWLARAMTLGLNEQQWRSLLLKTNKAHPISLMGALDQFRSE
jgi:hypothetical protein